MGRYGISYLAVANAAKELQGKGINPTVDNIREFLGTGSKSTLGPYLKQWREKQENFSHNTIGLPSELLALIKGLYERLQEEADAKVLAFEKKTLDEMNDLKNILEATASQKANFENELKTLKYKCLDTFSQWEETQKKLDIEQKSNSELQYKLQDHDLRQQEIIQLKHQVSVLTNTISELNQKLTSLREENKQLEKEIFERRGKTMELQEILKTKEQNEQEVFNV